MIIKGRPDKLDWIFGFVLFTVIGVGYYIYGDIREAKSNIENIKTVIPRTTNDLTTGMIEIRKTVDALINWKKYLEDSRQLQPSTDIDKLVKKIADIKAQVVSTTEKLVTLEEEYVKIRSDVETMHRFVSMPPDPSLIPH